MSSGTTVFAEDRIATFDFLGESEEEAARARLAAAAPEMARALLSFEWAGMDEQHGPVR